MIPPPDPNDRKALDSAYAKAKEIIAANPAALRRSGG